jgi:hypothetical protein
MSKPPLDLILGMVQMEIEHLNAKINSTTAKFRLQFEGIRASLEPLKHIHIDLEPVFCQPDRLDFDRLQFFSKSDGVEQLLSNPLLDAETIEDFRWKFFYYETKLEALRLEVEKLQNRSVKRGNKLDELIRNWLNPPDRILTEYKELLQGKRQLREQIREELLQNSNLAKRYVSDGLAQVHQFFNKIEESLPKSKQLEWNKRDSYPYELLAELKLLEENDYLIFWCSYSLARPFQLKATLEDHWHYTKAIGKQSILLEDLITWIGELLKNYEHTNNLVTAQVSIYNKLTDRGKIITLPTPDPIL